MIDSESIKNNRFNISNESALYVIFLAIGCFLILNAQLLPMTDLPQHAGQVAKLKQLIEGNAYYGENLTTNFFTPYLTGYSLIYIISLFFPIIASVNATVAIAFLFFCLTIWYLEKKTDALPAAKWSALGKVCTTRLMAQADA